MLTIENFFDKGYKKYKTNGMKSADFLLQKRIDDSLGKKYFINVWVYEFYKMPFYTESMHPTGFHPEVQFQRENDATVEISLIGADIKTIEDIESEFENFWNFLQRPYYERYYTNESI